MKKSLIAVGIIVAIIIALPIVGNSVMKQTIDDKLSELKSYGLETTLDETSTGYLKTSRHFEFLLKDSEKFITHLNSYADKQIPPYVNAMIEGSNVGADIQYSNLPFAKSATVELYPLSVSKSMKDAIVEDDIEFYAYIDKFLKSKGILYHIDYNLINRDFKGFIKDIDESYTLKDGSEVKFYLSKAFFDGNGELIAPHRITTNVKELYLDIHNSKINFKMSANKFKSSNNFESKTTYISSAEINKLNIALSGVEDNLNLELEDLKVNASSNTQGEKAEINSKSSVKSLLFKSNSLSFDLKEFMFDIALNDIDKVKFEEFSQLISESNALNSQIAEAEIEKKLLELLSKGVVLNMADFSLKNIILNTQEDLKGFFVKMNLVIKADDALAEKLKLSPILLVSDIEMKTKIKLSHQIYEKLTKNSMVNTSTIGSYAKMDRQNIMFDIDFVNSKLSINGKELK